MIPVSPCSFLSTHRLILSKYSPQGTVLSNLADTEDEVRDLVELDGSTNARLIGESGLLPGIGVHELIFGVPYSEIVNASFTHASEHGGRFHDKTRGAWYAGLTLGTSEFEVAYHRILELQETAWPEEEITNYDDYLADFMADFHDLRSNASAFQAYLKPSPVPHCYTEPQQLAHRLLMEGSNGIVYPSVRHKRGTCLACFRPALVYHVRRSHRLQFRLHAAKRFNLDQVKQVA